MINPIYKVLMPAAILLQLAACSSLRPLLVTDRLTPEEHVTLGETYQSQGMADLAAREFQAALHQKRNYPPALVGLGNLAFEKDNLKVAEDYYRRALKAAPNHPTANNNLAMVYLSRGTELEKAEQFAKRALARGGAIKPYALDTLAKIYMRQGRYEEAEAALKEAEGAVPAQNSPLHEMLAQSRQELAAESDREK